METLYCVTLTNKRGTEKREVVKARNLDQAMDKAESEGWEAVAARAIGFNPPHDVYGQALPAPRSEWLKHILVGALIASMVLFVIFCPL